MREIAGSLARHAARAACPIIVSSFITLCAAPLAAQQQPDQPVVSPRPDQPEFVSRADFQLSAAATLGKDDIRYKWDTHWGGSVDVIDYVKGRGGFYADYEAMLGNEFRVFDPNQGNYTLEAFTSARINETTELVGIFHHVSRHLSDRPKRIAIAWNLAGARLLKHLEAGTSTVDLDLEGGKITEYAFVDYSWIAEFHGQIRRPVTPRVTAFGRGMVQWYGINKDVSQRSRQVGGFGEGGVRLKGGAAVMELFFAVERRVDADQLERIPQTWALAGFRLLSR